MYKLRSPITKVEYSGCIRKFRVSYFSSLKGLSTHNLSLCAEDLPAGMTDTFFKQQRSQQRKRKQMVQFIAVRQPRLKRLPVKVRQFATSN